MLVSQTTFIIGAETCGADSENGFMKAECTVSAAVAAYRTQSRLRKGYNIHIHKRSTTTIEAARLISIVEDRYVDL